MNPWFIGVDPGDKGGVAAVSPEGRVHTFALDKVNDSAGEVHVFLNSIGNVVPVLTAVEDLRPIFGVSATSTFSLGWATGYWHGVFDSRNWSVYRVPPKEWQAAVTQQSESVPIDKTLPDREKRKLKALRTQQIKEENMRSAREHFPGVDASHDGVADALCIVEWLRRQYKHSVLK